MENVSVLAITKNGVNIGGKLKELFPNWNIFSPSKLSNANNNITWYSEPTSDKIIELFKNSNALICLFSFLILLIDVHSTYDQARNYLQDATLKITAESSTSSQSRNMHS